MARYETINGSKVTEEQIATWAAEGGADLEIARLRERGRARAGVKGSQIVAVRLTLGELLALDERARRQGKSRSEVIRTALRL